MDRQFDKLYTIFYSIQCEKYFEQTDKEIFDTTEEKNNVSKVISSGWDQYIETKKEKLLTMSERDIGNFFEAVELEFPRYARPMKGDIDSDEDELFDEDIEELSEYYDDDDDEDLDRDLELLNQELNELANELEDIPEEEREDVVMLMLAFPALQEIGFPVEVFLSGDGSAHLTAQQRQQIDWARQLAYKIVDMIEEDDTTQMKEKEEDVVRFASAFIPSDKIQQVITEIQTTYKRGRDIP